MNPTTDSQKPVLERLRELWPDIRGRGVKDLWIFGSRAREDGDSSSDLDLLVEFEEPPNFDAFMGLKLMLEDKLEMPVDLLSRSACSPRWLRTIESDLRHVA